MDSDTKNMRVAQLVALLELPNAALAEEALKKCGHDIARAVPLVYELASVAAVAPAPALAPQQPRAQSRLTEALAQRPCRAHWVSDSSASRGRRKRSRSARGHRKSRQERGRSKRRSASGRRRRSRTPRSREHRRRMWTTVECCSLA